MGHDEKNEKPEKHERHEKHGKNGKFEFLATLEASQAADYLSRIADGLRRGAVNLSAGGRTIHLAPTSMVKIELEAEGKGPDGAKGSLELEISWKEEYAAAPETLEISVDPREEVASARPPRE